VGVRVFGLRDFREAGDVQERSRLVNSIAAQEFGADATDPYGVEGVGVGLDAFDVRGVRVRLDATVERQQPLTIRATPAQGTFPRILPATPLRAVRLALTADRPTALSIFGTEVRASAELRGSRLTTDDPAHPIAPTTLGRAFLSLGIERPFGRQRLALQTYAGYVGTTTHAVIPPQEWLWFGGPLSAPGYDYHELGALAGVSQRVEWRTPVPMPAIPLGRFGRVPGEATLAPFVQGTLSRSALTTDRAHPTAVYPSVGVALLPFFDLLRVQVARGLRNGRWTLNVDVSRDFWGVL
jgi:hypothetical protein